MKTRSVKLSALGSVAAFVAALHGASNASASDYSTTILQDNPLAYYRLADTPPVDVATNSGSLGAAGNGIYFGAGHRTNGVLVADPNAAASFDGTGVRVAVPFNAALNPAAAQPFTIEAWILPTIEGLNNAQAALFNRHSSGNRQGWVLFQRSSASGGNPNGTGYGFNFRMYNQNGSSQSIDITGGDYTVGQWAHVAVVWSGTTATLYVNGTNSASQTAGYVANTDAPFSVGAYGANNPGDNPFTGAVDEVAFYPTALNAGQIAAHRANGLNASPSVPYRSVVLADGAIEYLRLDELNPFVNAAGNSGSLGAAGDGMHFPGAIHSVPGAIVGSLDTATRYSAIDTNSDDGGVPTLVPFNAALNPATSFSVEAWLRPTENGAGNAQSPIFNRDPNDANAPNRAGWDFFQRDAGTGWNFRMFNGNAHAQVFNITGGPYTVGQWCHLVAVYNSSVPSATLYLNGQQVATSSSPSGTYNPNPYAPLSIGGYGDGSQNPFVGDIDEVAVYTTVLSGPQVLAHYQNGTNASRATPYNSLIAADGAVEFLHLDEPARAVATNSGTLGTSVNATYVNTTNNVAGPVSPLNAGFETNNLAAPFDGVTSYIEMENPPGLNFAAPITMEAWILPGASQNSDAYIIGHGGNDTFTGEVFLRIESGLYEVGSISALASFAVPAGDLGGGNWVYLAGTWDGANWNLYRNGLRVATTPDVTGPSLVGNANWAVGARGRWKNVATFPASGEDRVFAGSIDEPAIYGTALGTNRIAAHYSAGVLGRTPLTIVQSGANAQLSWTTGILQSAPAITGPFTDVGGAAPPSFSDPISGGAKKFYRLRFVPQ